MSYTYKNGKVELVWITPNAENLISSMARVSNPKNQDNTETYPKLLNYLITHKHWSPFEMVSACVLIHSTRDITRQILRHRSFSYQERSGRYAASDALVAEWDIRMQDKKNRQNSIPVDNPEILDELKDSFYEQHRNVYTAYTQLLKLGFAKECVRKLLPEGFTPSSMYMSGNIRSWMHYLQVRTDPSTQKEHRDIANAIRDVLQPHFPSLVL